MNDRQQIVRTIYERWNRSEGDLALDLFDPEVEIHQMAKLFDSEGTFHGRQGLARSASELTSAFERIEWRPDELIDAGEWLVVPLTASGVGALSGIEADVQVTHVWRLRDGLVTEFSVYETKEAALQAVQLRELPEGG